MSEYKRTALVLGAGGFIGSHMVKRLRSEGYWVRGVDLKYPEYSETEANEFIQGDLRDVDFVRRVIQFKGYQGNHFNASNGRFVCPVAGVYRIYFRATVDQNQHTNVRLRKNGSTINEAYSNYSSGQTSSDSSEAVVSCSANDYLEIQASRLKAIGGTQHKQVTFELMS